MRAVAVYICFFQVLQYITSCTVANNSSRSSRRRDQRRPQHKCAWFFKTRSWLATSESKSLGYRPHFQVDGTSSYNLIGLGGSGGLVNGVNHNQVGVANPGLGSLGDNGGPDTDGALTPKQPCRRRRERLRLDNRSTRLRPAREHSENSKCRRRQRHWSIRG